MKRWQNFKEITEHDPMQIVIIIGIVIAVVFVFVVGIVCFFH